MRLTNQKNRTIYASIFNIILIFCFLSVLFLIIDNQQFHLFGNWNYLIIGISILSLIIYYLLGDQIFEFDSDGEALNFINKNIIPLKNKIVKDEFPKYKLQKFSFFSFFLYKRLYIIIRSKKDKNITLKYDISFLSKTQLKDLKISLQKVVKLNSENILIAKSKLN